MNGDRFPHALFEAPPDVLAALFDALPPFISVVDRDERYRWVNRRHQEWFGLPRKSLVGRSVREVVGAETYQALQPRIRAALRGERQAFELELRRPDGTAAWLELTYIPAGDRGFYALALDRSEERRRESVLRENEERYRTLVDTVPGAVYRCAADADLTVDTVSDAIAEITGHPAAEFEARRGFASIHHPDDAARVAHALRGAAAAGAAYEVEYRVHRSDGSVRWVYDKGHARRSAREGAPWLEGVMVDITARKQAQLALAESDARQRALLEAIPDLIFLVSRDGVYLDFHAGDPGALAFPPEAFLGRRVLEVMQEDPGPALMAAIDSACSTRRVQTLEYSLAVAERVRRFECRFVPMAGERVICIARDITERVQAEEAARAAAARLRWIADAVPGMLYQWRQNGPREGCFVYASARAKELLGYCPEEMLGEPGVVARLVPAEDLEPFWQTVERAWRDRDAWRHEFRIRAPDGRLRWLRGSAVPEQGADGSLVWNGFLLDVTEAKRAEEHLRLAAKVFETAAEAIVVTDAQLRILWVNRAFTEMTGYPEEEVLGQSPHILRAGAHDADLQARIARGIAEEGHWQGELTSRRRDGTLFPQWLSLSVVRDASGAATNYVALFSDITPIKTSQQRLEELANFDALTGLPNRNLLYDRLHHGLDKARRLGERVAVLFIDLDNFKLVNDTLGHDAGDRLLERVAGRLGETLREQDTVARLGGDEFVVVLEDAGGPEHAGRMAERIAGAFARPFDLGGHEHFVTLSIGISFFPDDATDLQGLLKSADLAMYRAKERGRNRFHFFAEGMNAQARERLFVEANLRRALEHGDFLLHFQPVVDIGSGRMRGAEALLRWQHPEHGLLAPARFVPVAEQSGLIVPLGEWVLRAACRQAAQWAVQGFGNFRVAVNISARQFDQGLGRTLGAVLGETGARPEWLELELTESALMDDPQEAAAILRELRDLGVGLSIDDFGTGYSSLAYLKRFPIDALKIDRAFVRDVGSDPDDAAIVTAIITMAHSLGVDVVAEGVESAEQLGFLRERGCDRGQGFLFGAPGPACELEGALRDAARPASPA